MAETPFPNPQTTVFNPSAWSNNTPLTQDELTYLDENFVSYPTTQSDVTFPVAPTVPTLTIGTGDTRAASAQFVQNAKNTQTWGALQTFNAGMVTNAINPLTDGGTLAIGNGATTNVVNIMTASNTGILTLGSSGSTTRLNVPLTPNYSYTAAGTGTGKIGETLTATFLSPTVTALLPQVQGQFLSFPIGVWILSGSAGRGGFNGFLTVSLSTTTDYTGQFAQDTMTCSNANNAINTVSYIVTNTAVQDYYLLAESSTTGSSWLSASYFFRAVRIA